MVCELTPAAKVTEAGRLPHNPRPAVANPIPGPPSPRFTVMESSGNPPRVMVNCPVAVAFCPGSGCVAVGHGRRDGDDILRRQQVGGVGVIAQRDCRWHPAGRCSRRWSDRGQVDISPNRSSAAAVASSRPKWRRGKTSSPRPTGAVKVTLVPERGHQIGFDHPVGAAERGDALQLIMFPRRARQRHRKIGRRIQTTIGMCG